MSLNEKAFLVKLERKMWVPYKFDRQATNEVESKHNVLAAGRFNKKLFYRNKQYLDIQAASTKVYSYHNSVTLPWRHDGFNILPIKLAFDYYGNMSRLIYDFQRTVMEFDFDAAVLEDKNRLGSLFNRGDYPSTATDFTSKFKISYNLYPVPSVDDFRISIPQEELDKFKEEMKSTERQLSSEIMRRISDVLVPVISQTMKENTRFHKSLKTNIGDLIPKLVEFNLTNDSKINEITSSLQTFYETLDIERMKDDESYRHTIRREADAILGRGEERDTGQRLETIAGTPSIEHNQQQDEEVEALLKSICERI